MVFHGCVILENIGQYFILLISIKGGKCKQQTEGTNGWSYSYVVGK